MPQFGGVCQIPANGRMKFPTLPFHFPDGNSTLGSRAPSRWELEERDLSFSLQSQSESLCATLWSCNARLKFSAGFKWFGFTWLETLGTNVFPQFPLGQKFLCRNSCPISLHQPYHSTLWLQKKLFQLIASMCILFRRSVRDIFSCFHTSFSCFLPVPGWVVSFIRWGNHVLDCLQKQWYARLGYKVIFPCSSGSDPRFTSQTCSVATCCMLYPPGLVKVPPVKY